MLNHMNFFKSCLKALEKPYICQKLYQNLELSRNSSGAKAPAICKIFIPGVRRAYDIDGLR
jgi:hypothetical protein